MRVLAGIGLGIVIFFPGLVFLQWISKDVLGLYRPMTLTDCCLVVIIILLSVIIVTGAHRPTSTRSSRSWGELNGTRPDVELKPIATRSTRNAARNRSVRERVDVTSVPGRPSSRSSSSRARAASRDASDPADPSETEAPRARARASQPSTRTRGTDAAPPSRQRAVADDDDW
jgi:hypothetical protein